MDCVFCKIVAGDIPSKKLYEDEVVYVFHDIQPQADVHFLVIPKQHSLEGVRDVTTENSAVVAHIFEVIAQLTAQQGITDYRVVANNGPGAGQTVDHLHFHVLSGSLSNRFGA